MKVLLSGSSGLIGTALRESLGDRSVVRLVRSRGTGTDVSWDPLAGTIDRERLEGLDAAVHLAGESIASGRWTARRKAMIRDSRVQGTATLSEALASLSSPPRVLVSASAIGFYGDRGEEILRESSGPGVGYLASACAQWEGATDPAERRGIRVVHLRLGIVLSTRGGALAKMLLPFRMGMGGVVGSGRQYMSWIALEDVVGIIRHALEKEDLKGPVNGVSPAPVTNREFTKTLGRVLGRPTIAPLPAVMARLLMGEMADALLLSSARVEPAALKASGYAYRLPQLEAALRAILSPL